MVPHDGRELIKLFNMEISSDGSLIVLVGHAFVHAFTWVPVAHLWLTLIFAPA